MEDQPDETPGDAAPPAEPTTPAAAGSTPPSAPVGGQHMSRRQKQSFRRQLLKELPRLGYDTWAVGQDLSVGEDLGSLIDLSVDAVLAPLESLVEER
jgi:hypothetical protein